MIYLKDFMSNIATSWWYISEFLHQPKTKGDLLTHICIT